MVPVTAEDVRRQKLRRNAKIAAAAIAVALICGWIYKRSVDPINARAAYDAGVRDLSSGRYQEAMLAFTRAIDLKSDFAEAYRRRGQTHLALRQTEQAIRDYTAAIQLKPDADSVLDRAAAYLDLENYPAAIEDCTRALALNPRLARAYNLRGVGHRSQRDPRGALPDFDRAVELSPDVDNYFQRGATYQFLGDHRRAIADFTAVIELEPGDAHPYLARAESLRATGDAERARADLERGRVLDGR